MSQHNLPELPARWYSVDSAGAATLCVDESDATRQAEQNNEMYPRFAPHRAVKLVALSEQGAGGAAQPARVVDERLRDAAQSVVDWHGELGHDSLAMAELRGVLLSTHPAAPTGGRQESSIHAGCSPIHRSQVAAPSQQADHSPDGGNMVEQQAGEVTELRAALWHIKNTAIALSDAQVIALEALAAYEAKKAGQQ